MSSLRGMTIPDLVADPDLVQRLIDEGETLFVERKARDPKIGLGATLASFANMLGGWLLLGVDDDGNVVGYEPPGTADLQDYIRDLLRVQIDPLPPFVALSIPVREHTIGVVHVVESSDQPHITSDGVIYRRNPGGKERVTEARDVLEMARRGEQARARAAQRQYGLPLITDAMRTPEHIYGDDPTRLDELEPLQEMIVRATPYTVSGACADRALSSLIVEHAQQVAASLLLHPDDPGREQRTDVEPRARGVYCLALQRGSLLHVDVVVDAGGVVALRMAERCDRLATNLVQTGWLQPLIEGAVALLAELDAYGRAAIGLELRGAANLTMATGPNTMRTLNAADLVDGDRLYVGGDIAVPASASDIDELVGRWTRELARAARLPQWEPGPEPVGSSEDESASDDNS